MITHLDDVTLKTGETVQSAILTAPEPEWTKSMLEMLSHKGDPWNWQNAAVLERPLELDANFYVLHRDGSPFANIMTVERMGVGIFGHVWTNPEDRQKGASGVLMEIQMADFRARKGRALYLITGNPVAHGLYERFGFQDVEEGCELMVYAPENVDNFTKHYFGGPERLNGTIRPLEWRHWPTACPLFIGDSPGIIRAASLGMIGRATPEDAFLPLLHRAEQNLNEPARSVVLELESGAVAGFATWGMHPIWPDCCIVDLYCHENYWSYGEVLLDALVLPATTFKVAYSEPELEKKNQLLETKGFRCQATMQNWLPLLNSTGAADVLVYRSNC